MKTKVTKQILAATLTVTLILPSVGALLCVESHGTQRAQHHTAGQMATSWTSADTPGTCNGLMACALTSVAPISGSASTVPDAPNLSTPVGPPDLVYEFLHPPSTPPPKA